MTTGSILTGVGRRNGGWFQGDGEGRTSSAPVLRRKSGKGVTSCGKGDVAWKLKKLT